MRHLTVFLMLSGILLLSSCSPSPEKIAASNEEKSQGSEAPNQGITPQEWLGMLKAEHPAWFACSDDKDCVGIQAECGSTCRSGAINSGAYSDYVVLHSKFCAGSGRVIMQCPYTKIGCFQGSCVIEFT